MKQNGRWLPRIVPYTQSADCPLRLIPIVELAGDGRVLIENHLGVRAYAPCYVKVSVCYGHVCVEGEGLEIAYMASRQLVITGTINSVGLERS